MKERSGNSRGNKAADRPRRNVSKKGDVSREGFRKDGFRKDDSKKGGFSRSGFPKQDSRREPFKKDTLKKQPFKKETVKVREDRNPYEEEDGALWLEGRNPVLEAINAGRDIDKIFVKKGEVEGSIKVILAKARDRGIVISEVAKTKLDEMSKTGNHQGIMATCPAMEYAEVSDMLEKARSLGEEPLLILLDGIMDPHNLGAIIRSACACGAHGVIIPKRRAVGISGIVARAAAGATEHVLVARVSNLTQTLDELKKAGLWAACADMGGQTMYSAPLTGAIALVVGGEGEGVSRLLKEHCDFSVGIPITGKIASLNASVAAAVVMFEIRRRRLGAN